MTAPVPGVVAAASSSLQEAVRDLHHLPAATAPPDDVASLVTWLASDEAQVRLGWLPGSLHGGLTAQVQQMRRL